MINNIALLVFWIAYALLEGRREAYYFHYANRSGKSMQHELHPLFFLQRMLVSLIIFIILPLKKAIVMLLVFALVFSWFHNGMYYFTRNRLDEKVYKKGWTDNSISSTAKLDFDFYSRTTQLFLGILLWEVLFCF